FRSADIPLDRFLQVANGFGIPSGFLEVKLIAPDRESVDLFQTSMEDFEIASGFGNSGDQLSKHDPPRCEGIVREVSLGRGEQLVEFVGYLLQFAKFVQIGLTAVEKFLIAGEECGNILLKIVRLVVPLRRAVILVLLGFVREGDAAGTCLSRI